MAGVGKFKWNGPAFTEYTQKQLEAALDKAWQFFQKQVRDSAGITNTGQVIKLKGGLNRDAKGRFTGGGRSRKVKAGSRVPIYIPGVGWRMSKNVRKRGGARNKSQITIYPNSSKPGQALRRRTGIGQKNIVGGRQGMRARVGYTAVARYMTFHEIGIRYPRGGLQKRPTMMLQLRRQSRNIAEVMRRAAEATKP